MHVQARDNNYNAELVTGQSESLGRIKVERAEEGLFSGVFTPGPAFASVERLFSDFEEAVGLQALSVVDQLDGQISRLGLSVVVPPGQRVPVEDVQIWSDGQISFRPIGQGANGLDAFVVTRPSNH
jgi:hypothetical protein